MVIGNGGVCGQNVFPRIGIRKVENGHIVEVGSRTFVYTGIGEVFDLMRKTFDIDLDIDNCKYL